MHDPPSGELGPEARLLLLALARETLRRAVSAEPLPTVSGCQLPPGLAAAQGCFITLTRKGELRGCIGNVEPHWPLWQAVIENTRAAATADTRFPPVSRGEVDDLQIEISVLSPLESLPGQSPEALLARLQPGRDGVVLELGARRATFLPQVWERLPDKARFMSQLALKAGVEANGWRQPEAVVHTYQVEHFAEADS